MTPQIFLVTVEYFLQEENAFEPIRCWPIRLLWKKKSKLPRSFDALLLFIAKYHGNKEPTIKKLCKRHLSYNKKKAHKGK